MRTVILTIVLSVIIQLSGNAQTKYSAPWISYPSANVTQYGVYHFRKSFDLEKVPNELVIHVNSY